MSTINVSFKPGWVHDKDDLVIGEKFAKILKFFVWSTPNLQTSSSERTMVSRGWEKDVWMKKELRDYLLRTANLNNGFNFAVARKLKDMTTLGSKIGINGHFQTIRKQNCVLMYNNGKENDILQLFYYIRCAFAHGRFQVQEDNNVVVYVMEAVTKSDTSYILKARLVLMEDILVDWVDTVIGGPAELSRRKEKIKGTYFDQITTIVNNNLGISKSKICDMLPLNKTEANRVFLTMKNEGKIEYNLKAKSWILK